MNHECQKPMIHSDIKRQNILLYKYLTAHLGYFGLVKLVHEFSNQSELCKDHEVYMPHTL